MKKLFVTSLLSAAAFICAEELRREEITISCTLQIEPEVREAVCEELRRDGLELKRKYASREGVTAFEGEITASKCATCNKPKPKPRTDETTEEIQVVEVATEAAE